MYSRCSFTALPLANNSPIKNQKRDAYWECSSLSLMINKAFFEIFYNYGTGNKGLLEAFVFFCTKWWKRFAVRAV